MIRLNADHLFVPIVATKNGFNCSKTMLPRYLKHSWFEKYNESKTEAKSMMLTDVGDGYVSDIWRRW